MAAPQAAAQLLPPLLLALTAPSLSFWVRSWPRIAVVRFGGSVSINCSRGWCPEPAPPPELHWLLSSRTGPAGRRWRSYVLTNVSQWQPEPALCVARCGNTTANGSTALVVYKPPAWVQLDSVPPLPVPVGSELTLLCHVAECGPLANLTVTLRRGTETLSSHRFPTGTGTNETGNGNVAAAITVRHALNAGLEDHGQVALCHAELSLRPHGPLFARAAPPIRIEVYALPSPPQLFPPPHLEAGSQSSFSCVVRGAFPLAETRVLLELDGTPLEEAELSITEEALTAIGRIRTGTVGISQLKCTAAVGGAERSTTAPIRVYRFPAPTLELSPVPAGRPVSVRCRSALSDPPSVRLQLFGSDGSVLAEGPQPELELSVVPQRWDDGRRVGCRASMELGGGERDVVTKETHGSMEVLYPPEMNSTSCPPSVTWLEGSVASFSCTASGNPSPTVTCFRFGDRSRPGSVGPIVVNRTDAGLYRCDATNSVGSRSRTVSVRVEYEPKLSDLGCPSHLTWLEGQRWELPCAADGDPRPITQCSRAGGPIGGKGGGGKGGGGGGRRVSRHDAGQYVCTATNRHGAAQRDVSVSVEYQPSIGDAECPQRRLWLEGATAELGCNASGNPPPNVNCFKYGDDPRGPPPDSNNVTRAHAGIYQCRASNVHGTAMRNVTVTVEYSPASLTLRVLPSPNVSHGGSFSVECGAEGIPTPNYGWSLPPAPNIRYGADNRTVLVDKATAGNGGRYSCTASNRHGRSVGSVVVSVDESRLALLLSLVLMGSVTALAAAAWGLYYLKSTACKKGEYNVSDAEGSSEASRLHGGDNRGQGELFGIPLSPT